MLSLGVGRRTPKKSTSRRRCSALSSLVEMDPGDGLVFDGNLLHRSDANRTDTYRWGYICSYNAVENAPFKKVRDYGNYEPLRKVPAGSFRMAS